MMKKKTLNLSSLLKNTDLKYSSPWPWPYYCHQPRTLSFRGENNNQDDLNNTFKIINSAYLEPSESLSPKASSLDESGKTDSTEPVIRGLPSDRFFFEPDDTNSILDANNKAAVHSDSESESETTQSLPFKDSVVLSMESQDPYVDFRKSMEEIVEAHDVKDWECLQGLLCWYLKVNEKNNHGYIVGAFVDLLVGLAFASTSSSFSSSSSSSSRSPFSPLSFYSSSMSSSYCTRCASCSAVREDELDTSSSSMFLEQVREENDDDGEDEVIKISKIETSTSSSSSSSNSH